SLGCEASEPGRQERRRGRIDTSPGPSEPRPRYGQSNQLVERCSPLRDFTCQATVTVLRPKSLPFVLNPQDRVRTFIGLSRYSRCDSKKEKIPRLRFAE